MARVVVILGLLCSLTLSARTPDEKSRKLAAIFDHVAEQERTAINSLFIVDLVFGAGMGVLAAVTASSPNLSTRETLPWFFGGSAAGFLGAAILSRAVPTVEDRMGTIFKSVENVSTRVRVGEDYLHARKDLMRVGRQTAGTLFGGLGAGFVLAGAFSSTESTQTGSFVSGGIFLGAAALMFLLRTPIEVQYDDYENWLHDSASAKAEPAVRLEFSGDSLALRF